MSSNRWEAEQETKERAHNNAVRELAETRHWAKEYITEAEVEGVPPYRTLINENPPVPGNIHGRRNWRPPSWGDALRGLHAYTLDLWTEVRPYQDRLSDDWDDEIAEIRIPYPGGWSDEETGRFNQTYEQRGVSYKSKKITMKNLSENWRFQSITLACRNGERVIPRQEKIYLPAIACRIIYEKLNDSLRELGLLAEVREREGHATDPGVPDDIDDWGYYDVDE